ncbi:MAG: ATP-dependent DNA helicase [Thermodesulfobacteriota bacterium]
MNGTPGPTPKQQEILNAEGNVLVTANPGTGKTFLLSRKYLKAVRDGIPPEEILCLTFTDKARREMEERIIGLLTESGIKPDLSKLNIYTFHSYALENLERGNIVSSNLLRFTVYKYLADEEVFNYASSHLIDTIVPKVENLIRYLKSFGITPAKINLEKTLPMLEGDKKISKKEKEIFAREFVKIFERYEEVKKGGGMDYADLLINFLRLEDIPRYEIVLVDELQDVNRMEAEIAIRSGKRFFAVGDKKQAIFGFQGGSILNFSLFEKSSHFILSENWRSTDEILAYAREYFVSKTKDESHGRELSELKSAGGLGGEKPVIYHVERKLIPCAVAEILKSSAEGNGTTAVIARTNGQIMEISRELTKENIPFSSTFLTASNEARTSIIKYLRGMLSNNIDEIKNALVTPFSPVSLQDAFDILDDRDATMETLREKVPVFMAERGTLNSMEDVNRLFTERIIPAASPYGREYFTAAINLQDAFQEALGFLKDMNRESLLAYLRTADLTSDEIETDSGITLTTVHKAKGKEYDTVIYAPFTPPDKSNYQDEVVESILRLEGIDAEEELEEETLRINFVAFTRAKRKLAVVTEKFSEFHNAYAAEGRIEVSAARDMDLDESRKKAFTCFVSGEFERAKDLLERKESWLTDYVKNFFVSLGSISFSSINNKTAYEFLVKYILRLREDTKSLSTGLSVHAIADELIKSGQSDCAPDLEPFKTNITTLLDAIRLKYPESHATEMSFKVPLGGIIDTEEELLFAGFIDAVFRNGDSYLIVDWKTDRNTDKGSEHRQQLEAYKRAFCLANGLDPDKVKVSIGFVGLRSALNTGTIECVLDDQQPRKTAFETFTKKVGNLLRWKKDPESFFHEILEAEINDPLWRSIVEQYMRERKV